MLRLLFFILLAGCGAAPTPQALELRLEDRADGAYIAGCPTTDGIEAHRARGAERWSIGDPPLRTVGPPACPAPQPLPWTHALSDGRVWSVHAGGMGLAQDGDYQFWRPAPAMLSAATWDGQLVYAVGDSGLWRWRPGPGAAVAVPLPADLAGAALRGVFRDGEFIWVFDDQRRGRALDVRGPVAVGAGEPGTLRVADATIRTRVGPHDIAGTAGVAELAVGRRKWSLSGPLHALLPDHDALYVVAGRRLTRSAIGEDGEQIIVGALELPGPTVALFAEDAERLILVGADYGFARVTVRRTSGSARSPRPAR